MDVGKTKIVLLIQLSLLLFGLPIVSANTDCGGKAFHCVNITHFQICVDLGGGISTTVEDFFIQCPQGTGCLGTNHFECEFLPPTTPTEIIQTSEVTNEIEWISNASSTTIVPQKNVSEVEHSENLKSTITGTIVEGTTDIITTATTSLNDILTSVDINIYTTIAPESVSSVQQSEADQTTVPSDTTVNSFASTDAIHFYATTKSSDLQADTVRSDITNLPLDYVTNVPTTVSNTVQYPSVTEAINSDVTNINAEFDIYSTTVSNSLHDPVASETLKSGTSNLNAGPGVDYPSTINISNEFETVTEITDSPLGSNLIFIPTTSNDLQTSTQSSIIIANVDSNSINLATISYDLLEPSATEAVILDTDLNTIFTTTNSNDLKTDTTPKSDIMIFNINPNPKVSESENKYGTNDNFKTTNSYDFQNPSVTETLRTDDTIINSDLIFSTTLPTDILADATTKSDIINSNVDSNNVYTTSIINDSQYSTPADTVMSDIVNLNDFKTTTSYDLQNSSATETVTSVDVSNNVDVNFILSTTIADDKQTDTSKRDILDLINNDWQNSITTETVTADIGNKNNDFRTTVSYDSLNPYVTETINVDTNVNVDLNSIVSTTISNDKQTDTPPKSDIIDSNNIDLISINNDGQNPTTVGSGITDNTNKINDFKTTIPYDSLNPSALETINVDTNVNVHLNSIVSTTISNYMKIDTTPQSDILDSKNIDLSSINKGAQNPITIDTMSTDIAYKNNDFETTISYDSQKTISLDTTMNVDSTSIVSDTTDNDMQTDTTPKSDILDTNNVYLTSVNNVLQNEMTTATVLTDIANKNNDLKTTASYGSLLPYVSKIISVSTNKNVDTNKIIATLNNGSWSKSSNNYLENQNQNGPDGRFHETKTEKNDSVKTTISYDSSRLSVIETIKSDDTNLIVDTMNFSTTVSTDFQKDAISVGDILNSNLIRESENKIATETMISDIHNKNADLFNVDSTTISYNLQSPLVDETVPSEITGINADSGNKYSTMHPNTKQTDTTNDVTNTLRDSLTLGSIDNNNITTTTYLNGSEFKQATKKTSVSEVTTEIHNTGTNVYDSLNKNIVSNVVDAMIKNKEKIEGIATSFQGQLGPIGDLDETTTHFYPLNYDHSYQTDNGEVNGGKNGNKIIEIVPPSKQLFINNNEKRTTLGFDDILVRTTESTLLSNINKVTLDNSDLPPIYDVNTISMKTSDINYKSTEKVITSSHIIYDVTTVGQETLNSNNGVLTDIPEKSLYSPLAKETSFTELPYEISISSAPVTKETHTVDNVKPLDNLKKYDVNQYFTADKNTSKTNEIRSKEQLTNLINTAVANNNEYKKELPFEQSTTYGYTELDVRTTDHNKSVFETLSSNSNIVIATDNTIDSNQKVNVLPSTEENYHSVSEKADKFIQLGNVATIDLESKSLYSQVKSIEMDVHVSSNTVSTISQGNFNNNLLVSENNEVEQKMVPTNTKDEEQGLQPELKKLNSVISDLEKENLKSNKLPKIQNNSPIADLISTKDSSVFNLDPKPTDLSPSDIPLINVHENITSNKPIKTSVLIINQTTSLIGKVTPSYNVKLQGTKTTNTSFKNKTMESNPLELLILNETSKKDSTNKNKNLNIQQISQSTAKQNTTEQELSNIAKDYSLLTSRPGNNNISEVTETISDSDVNLIKYLVINPDRTTVLKNIETARTASQTIVIPSKSVSSDSNINNESINTKKTAQFGTSLTSISNKTMESNHKSNQSKIIKHNHSETNNPKQHEGFEVGTPKNVQRMSIDSAKSITETVTVENMKNADGSQIRLVQQKPQSKKSDSTALTDSSPVVRNNQNQNQLPRKQQTLHTTVSVTNASTSDKSNIKLNKTDIKNRKDFDSQLATKTPSNSKQNKTNVANAFDCKSHPRGRYADMHDCRKFYICIGKNQRSIVGSCPNNTVFDSIKKQCTKNLSHCIRNNQFQCSSAGRYSDLLQKNVYYICVKNRLNSYVKFKFQCQKGFALEVNTVKCITKSNTDDSRNRSKQVSSSDSSNSKKETDQSARESKSERSVSVSREKIDFECEEEGRFADPNDCRRYFICKQKHSEFRRKRRKCDSDELFHKNKKKCVDAESYECDL